MKICPSCNVNKPLSDFNKNKSRKDGLQRQCRNCTQLADKKCYTKQGTKIRTERNSKVIARNREFVLRYKKMFGKCVDCGIKDYRVLQFEEYLIKNLFYQFSFQLERLFQTYENILLHKCILVRVVIEIRSYYFNKYFV
jgi:hypothetical protein